MFQIRQAKNIVNLCLDKMEKTLKFACSNSHLFSGNPKAKDVLSNVS
jgi:hypothetical protein